MDVDRSLVADAAWEGEMVTVIRTVTAYGASVVAVTTATKKAGVLLIGMMTAATTVKWKKATKG
jgi:hypothetical protein